MDAAEVTFNWLRPIVAMSVGSSDPGPVFWPGMLADGETNESARGDDEIVWVLIILFTHVIRGALYFFVRQPRRRAGAAS